MLLYDNFKNKTKLNKRNQDLNRSRNIADIGYLPGRELKLYLYIYISERKGKIMKKTTTKLLGSLHWQRFSRLHWRDVQEARVHQRQRQKHKRAGRPKLRRKQKASGRQRQSHLSAHSQQAAVPISERVIWRRLSARSWA